MRENRPSAAQWHHALRGAFPPGGWPALAALDPLAGSAPPEAAPVVVAAPRRRRPLAAGAAFLLPVSAAAAALVVWLTSQSTPAPPTSPAGQGEPAPAAGFVAPLEVPAGTSPAGSASPSQQPTAPAARSRSTSTGPPGRSTAPAVTTSSSSAPPPAPPSLVLTVALDHPGGGAINLFPVHPTRPLDITVYNGADKVFAQTALNADQIPGTGHHTVTINLPGPWTSGSYTVAFRLDYTTTTVTSPFTITASQQTSAPVTALGVGDVNDDGAVNAADRAVLLEFLA